MSAQVSLYPLGQENLAPGIQRVLEAFQRHGLPYEIGAMSTIVWGEDAAVFAALQDAFQDAAEYGPTVMVITVSNACPAPKGEPDE